jgi:hypothetical protein
MRVKLLHVFWDNSNIASNDTFSNCLAIKGTVFGKCTILPLANM